MYMNAVFYKILNSESLERASLSDEGWAGAQRSFIRIIYYGLLRSHARVSNGVGQRGGGCPPGELVPLSAQVACTG